MALMATGPELVSNATWWVLCDFICVENAHFLVLIGASGSHVHVCKTNFKRSATFIVDCML